MAEEKYILVSLEDERTEKLANVLASKTSKKILDLLAEKELSESEIASELKMPLNTIDYNIKNLLKTGLIEEKRHLFSVKGKRIPVYKISNKYIVISPRKKRTIASIFPVVIISAIFTGFILWFNRVKDFAVQQVVPEASETVLKAGNFAEEAVKTGFKLGTIEIFLIIIWLAILAFIMSEFLRNSEHFRNS